MLSKTESRLKGRIPTIRINFQKNILRDLNRIPPTTCSKSPAFERILRMPHVLRSPRRWKQCCGKIAAAIFL